MLIQILKKNHYIGYGISVNLLSRMIYEVRTECYVILPQRLGTFIYLHKLQQ
jgi:hypothetical protein